MLAFFLGFAFGASITATVWYAWRKWQAYQLDQLCMSEDEFCAGLYRMMATARQQFSTAPKTPNDFGFLRA